MKYRVVFAPEAAEQLTALHRYIAQAGSPQAAPRYTEAIIDYCERLCAFPIQGIFYGGQDYESSLQDRDTFR